MALHKKQHYIPQCYLKMFSDNNTHIWAYDKISKKSYGVLISDVCTANNFYTISDSFIKENNKLNPFTIEENFFAEEYEPKFAEKLFHLQQLANDAYKNNELRIRLSRKEKYEFALLLVIQWFRLPALRIENEEVFEDMMPKMVRLFQEGLALELNNPDIAKLRIQSKIKDKAVYHAESTFMNEDLLDRYSTLLSNNIWTFNYSVNGDFYTSDFPITVNPHVNNVKPICQGLAQYGAELTFPISKNLLLTIWDKDYFSDKESDECKMEVVHGRDLREANHIRTMYAQSQLFSNKNNFEFIDFISRIMPITKNPFR